MKTYAVKAAEIEREWYVVDAAGQNLGRLASRIAIVLRGKHKAKFTPSKDLGDFVIVVNAEKIAVTGRKLENKMYYRYSGYPGGLKEQSADRMRQHKPESILRLAVKRMLPKSKMGRQMLSKLKIYAGPDHPHQAQAPVELEL